MKILFVTWDGPQVSYLESLFVPIFDQLQQHDIYVHVLQFTWGDEEKIASMRQVCQDNSVEYHHIKVCRKLGPVGPLATVFFGQYTIRKLIKVLDIDTVMPRSNLPALATLLALRTLNDVKFVFDADGLPLDEKVDFSGLSASSLSYRLLRDVEAEAVRRADIVLTRTKLAKPILVARAGASTLSKKFHVVSNGRDEGKFKLIDAQQREQVRSELSVALDAPLLVYAGSLGGQYCLEEMFNFFSQVKEKRADAKFLVLSGDLSLAERKLIQMPHLKEAVMCRSVKPDAVPSYLAVSDLGFALRRNSFSMQAVAPIKIGEYLLCGLPVIATKDVGDTQVIDESVGRLVENYEEETFMPIVDWFFDDVLVNREENRIACRKVGLEHFSLNSSVAAYNSALRKLES